MSSEYEMSVNDYIAVIKHRAVLLIVTVAVIIGASVLVATSMPPIYQSSGTILVESQQISPDLVAGNNNTFADERIEVIRQRVMTREHLEAIINKYNLFETGTRRLTLTEKIEEMRNAISVALVSAAVKGRGEVTIAFRLAFEHREPEVANEVAKELVTLFLNENIKQRTERASETTEFLTQEANKLRTELEVLENKLADFKQAHGNALPEHQELRMNMLSRSELELKDIDRDYKAANEELRFQDLELSAAHAGLATRAATAGTPGCKRCIPKRTRMYGRLSARLPQCRQPRAAAVPSRRSAWTWPGCRRASPARNSACARWPRRNRNCSTRLRLWRARFSRHRKWSAAWSR